MTRLGGYRVIVHPGHVTPRKILVQLACLAALRPAGAAERCTVRLSPGDDLQQAVDGSAASGRATIVCLGAGEIRLRRFLAIART